MSVPSAPPPDQGSVDPPGPAASGCNAFTIGIVDDDDDVRSALEAMLESHGYATCAFGSAEALLAFPGLGQLAGVITDLQMPGMGGIELIQVLKSRAIPSILITAFATPVIERQAHAAGVHCFLRKPFGSDRLIEALETMMGRPAS